MTVKREYRNAVRSHQMIRTAFVELLHEKPFEKITATDIINRSGINRSTFYAHYPDANGVMEEIINEVVVLFREMLQEMDFTNFLNDPAPFVRKVISFLDENQELYRLLGKSDHSYYQLEVLKQILIQQVFDTANIPFCDMSNPQTIIRVRMLLGGVIDTFKGWLAGKIPCSLEEVSAEVTKTIVIWASK